MELFTPQSQARGVAERWRQQYDVEKWRNDEHKQSIGTQLDALPVHARTPEVVASIIGNDSWTQTCCDECGVSGRPVVLLGQELDYESATAEICIVCLRKAVVLVGVNPDA